jgi:hypothetical protein
LTTRCLKVRINGSIQTIVDKVALILHEITILLKLIPITYLEFVFCYLMGGVKKIKDERKEKWTPKGIG